MTEALMSQLGQQIRMQSIAVWGSRNAVHLVGCSDRLMQAQKKLVRFAQVDSPVLITGESGVGKELFAKALYLLSTRCGKPFLSINCAQYQNENLLVSEIFGHKRGSFTGAAADHQGLFEAADGGVLFLDEVGELTMQAQAMLLRALSEGEIRQLGGTRARHVDVRVVAATNRPLWQMVEEKTFRADLYYRLRYLHVQVPPIRQRDDDWRLLARFFLSLMARRHQSLKQFAPAAWTMLQEYAWPGNVREIRSIVDAGYCLADGEVIEPLDFAEFLDRRQASGTDGAAAADEQAFTAHQYTAMLEEGVDFWRAVREPFLDRELNRAQVQAIVKRGLEDANGSYKKMLDIFQVQQDDYLKFMDFLRHHRLKPERS